MNRAAVIVNSRPILSELIGWIADCGTDVVLLTSCHSIVDDSEIDALRAAGVDVTVLDDYDAPSVTGLIHAACERVRAGALISLTEADVIRCATVRERLGIIGQDTASATAYRDKYVMKSHCSLAGIKTAAMARADDDNGLARLAAGAEMLVVKPVRGVAAKNTYVAHSLGAVRHLLDEIGHPSDFLVEEFVIGDMYHVDGLMLDGKVIQSWPSRYLYQQWQTMYEAKPNLSAMLPADDPLTERLNATTANVVTALPPAAGLHALHAEYFVRDDDRIVLCEIASRTGGAGIVEAYERSFGVSLYGEPLRQQLGAPPSDDCFADVPRQRHGWGWFPPRRGTLVALPDTCALPGTVRYSGTANVGRRFDGPHAVTDAVVEVSFALNETTPVLDTLRAYDAWWRKAGTWA